MSSDTVTVEVVTNRDRLSGIVQAVGRRPGDISRRWWESTAIFLVFGVFYSLVGLYLVVHLHVLGFETLDRFDRALMIFWNRPPKLSAIGFDYPPLSVLLVAPFTVIPALARSMIVIPISSAIFAGLVMVFVNTMLRRASVIFPLRLAILATLGLNPLVVMYASIGSRNFLWLAFVMAALGALFAWYVTADIRFVMIAGLAYATAALTGYGSLTFFVISAIMVSAILSRLGADGTEIEGTTVGFAAPTVYVITLWTAFNLIILFKPLNWLTSSSDAGSSGDVGSYSLGDILSGVGQIVLYGAPIAIIVLPALIFSGISKRNGFALWLGLILAVSIVAPGFAVLLHLTNSPLLLNNAIPILLVSVVGAIWLARSAISSPLIVAALLAAGLLVSIPWTFHFMTKADHQGLETAFHNALTTGDSQEGTTLPGGSVVGYANEQDMATYIRDHINVDNAILTDNAQTYGVIFYTGNPGLFFDRVDQSDGPWQRAAKDPAAHAQYLLLSTDTSRDLLSQLYPDTALGVDTATDPLKTVFADDRYRLVSVPAGFKFGEQNAAPAPAASTDATTSDPCSASDAPTGGIDGQLGEPDSCQPIEPDDVSTAVPTDGSTTVVLPGGGSQLTPSATELPSSTATAAAPGDTAATTPAAPAVIVPTSEATP